MLRGGDAGLAGQPQRDLLPGLHAVAVGLPREFRDGKMAVLVDDGRFGARAAEGGARRKDKLEILVRFLVPENPFGDLEQPAELDERRNASANGRLERLFTHPAESERAKTSLVSDAKQVVALQQGANSTAVAYGETTFGSLH
jgi:hypothetical protein